MEEDALASYLDALSRDSCYRVQDVLKEAPHEVTERVYFTGSAGGELGPFVRKRIRGEAGLGQAYRELFQAQQAGRRFLHLPRIYDVHERDGWLIVVMEYVTGRTLADEVYERDASPALAAELFPALCDGVAELHEGMPLPIIHRDLKPANVIINGQGLTIIDFGIARTYREGAATDTTQFGTRAYAPPEQFGYGQTDQRSDVYALGMMLYYLLAEENPDSALASQGFPKLQATPALQAVVRKATAFDPDGRYQSARELRQAFLEALAAERARAQQAQAQACAMASQPAQAASAPAVVPQGPAHPVQMPVMVPGPTGAPAQQAMMAAPSGLQAPMAQQPDQVPQRVRATEVLGLIWDLFVVLFWLLCMAVLVWGVVSPAEANEGYPRWFLAMEFLGFVGLLLTGVGYGVLDKRWLRRHIPLLRNQTFGRGWAVAGIIIAASMAMLAVMVVVVNVTGNFGLPTPTAP